MLILRRIGARRYVVRYMVLILSVALAGCAAGPAGSGAEIHSGSFGQYAIGSETYVKVANVYNEKDASPLADAHCAKFGKAARFDHIEEISEQVSAIFDCVARQ
jgi:hypothetical protein